MVDNVRSGAVVARSHLGLGRQGLDLLDEEGVRLHHDDQRDPGGLLHAAHQPRVVHHLRPLAQGRRHLAAPPVGPGRGGRQRGERFCWC